MSWYSDKLATLGVQPLTQQPQVPRGGPVLPAHLAPYAQQPVTSPGPAQGQQQGPPASDWHSGAEALKGVQQKTENCPNCGGGNLYVLNTGGVINRNGERIAPMQCDDCGWPRTQQFSKLGAGNLAKPTGPAQAARQLPPGHVPDVVLQQYGNPNPQR